MIDVVDLETRRKMMAGIKAENTVPEILVRKVLHRAGFRFRLHSKKLPGKPDIVLPKYKVAIFVQGCFWHGHGCHLFKWPSTREKFWKEKIYSNIDRDSKNRELLLMSNWRVLNIWECSFKGKNKIDEAELLKIFENWIRGDKKIGDIPFGQVTN